MKENVELLKSLGLSEAECSIYFGLLEKPEGETIDRALLRFDLPESEAETAVKKLVEKGAVKVVSNKLELVPPKQFFARMIEEKRREIERQLEAFCDAVSRLEKSIEPLYWEGRLGVKPEEIIEPLKDLPAMEIQTVRIIANAEKEIFIFAETFGWYEKIREELFRAIERGVKTKVLMMVIDPESARRSRELKQLGVETRHCVEEWYPVRGTLADNNELAFLIWATKKRGITRPVYYRPHYTRNAGLIRVFSDAFRKRWEEAKPIE